ncbi:alpha-glucosidase [Halotalea alkalilenta]|uniref:alpha-glucosidase n=1 Tax=Halotalea alkalilenta TaxID=376489 RepID=UPI0004889B43|nr:alpha-glucosidase [Halotalea alkalilenta]
MLDGNQWWRGCVLYQVYPASFMDANDDGIGDLAGVAARLEHIAGLGVDGIWLSPFFTSPMKDFGYDISDYRDVDPRFGTLADFRALIDRAHALGLKVIIDQVLSHSSDRHPWFAESRASRDNPKADWYVWADPRPDGTPPNNWLGSFGGPAWSFDTRRHQYYFHNFLPEQPDLNFHHPEVQQAQLETLEFWLELGVDGFRFDVVNFYFHDAALTDNPAVDPEAQEKPLKYSRDLPRSYQWQRYTTDRPENLEFLKRIRALMRRYPGTTTVGEVGGDRPLSTMKRYTSGGDKLHMAYTFDLLGSASSAAYLRGVIERFEHQAQDAWPCWALSNHDVERMASRWQAEDDPVRLRLLLWVLLCLRGSVCLYQGDELGLPEAQVPYERLRDPAGINGWPRYKGRDGCRTPMAWEADASQLGFSEVEPWLPVEPRHRPLAADRQREDRASLYHWLRQALSLRRAHPALHHGEIALLEAGDDWLAFVRRHEDERLLCVFNLSSCAGNRRIAVSGSITPLGLPCFDTPAPLSGPAGLDLELDAHQALFARVD